MRLSPKFITRSKEAVGLARLGGHFLRRHEVQVDANRVASQQFPHFESAQVGGSVGRCSEFDRDFMPAKASVEARWKYVDRAFHRSEDLPPVSLYKVGGFYFVLDGHHRVSVAHFHGVHWIDAEVTEFNPGLRSDRRDNESLL